METRLAVAGNRKHATIVSGMRIFLPVILLLLPYFSIAGQDYKWILNRSTKYNEAIQLERSGKPEEAFVAFLENPGYEYHAARIGRSDPQKYLEILKRVSMQAAPKFAVQGDLQLAMGNKLEALALYRKAVSWLPSEEYLVEPPRPKEGQPFCDGRVFSCGPGSHRDNWLLRRYIALKAWEDTEAEFLRIAKIYQTRAEPYVSKEEWRDDQGACNEVYYVVVPPKFEAGILLFTIDHAFFLKQLEKTDDALALLLAAFKSLDLDRGQYPEQLQSSVEVTQYYPLVEDRFYWQPPGTSQKEFIRIAFAMFKTENKEEALVKELQNEIAGGNNRMRKVLAQVFSCQGNIDEALSEELRYIDEGNFDPFSSAYRRARIYESFQHNDLAAQQYETVLNAEAVDQPDVPYQEPSRHWMIGNEFHAVTPRNAILSNVFQRLQELYSDNPDRSLRYCLAGLAEPGVLIDFSQVEQAAQRFRAAGREDEFRDWALQVLRSEKDPDARANLLWNIGRYLQIISELPLHKSSRSRALAEHWKFRFSENHPELLPAFLSKWIQMEPSDVESRLELLALQKKPTLHQKIQSLELVLQYGDEHLFQQGGKPYQYKNYFDTAYRLMRLYEKVGRKQDIIRLGIRIAKGEKPFDKFPPGGYGSEQQDGSAALAIAIQTAADSENTRSLSEALKSSRWIGSAAQMERTLSKSDVRSKPVPAPAWANATADTTILASSRTVLSLARDDHHVFAGHPWGVSVYTFDGQPVTRMALGSAALCMTVAAEALWVGTPNGLFRIDANNYDVSRVLGDVLITALAAKNNTLWIGTWPNVRSLDLVSHQMQIYSSDVILGGGPGDIQRFLFDQKYVWADSRLGLWRLDPESGRWSTPPFSNRNYRVQLIDEIDGVLWGSVWTNDHDRYRPCRINRDTLELHLIPLKGQTLRDGNMINDPLSYYGKLGNKLVFSAGASEMALVYDPLTDAVRKSLLAEIKNLLTTDVPSQFLQGDPYRTEDGSVIWDHSSRQMIKLPDGIRVIGEQQNYPPEYRYPEREKPFSLDRFYGSTPGGLYLSGNDSVLHLISEGGPIGNNVFSILDLNGTFWMSTEMGLSLFDSRLRWLRDYTVQDGLLSSRITSSILHKGKSYFATPAGLAIYNPVFGIFTFRTESDGLPSHSVVRLQNENNRVRLFYQPERAKNSSYDYQQFAPSLFDPVTASFSVSEAEIMNQTEATTATDLLNSGTVVPVIGGSVLQEFELDGKKWIAGSRGVVVLEKGKMPEPAFDTFPINQTPDQVMIWKDEAEHHTIRITAPADFENVLSIQNPFIRLNSLRSFYSKDPAFGESLVKCFSDPVAAIRMRCVELSQGIQSPEIISGLQQLLKDPEDGIMYKSAIILGLAGHRPSLQYFEDIFENQASLRLDTRNIYDALATDAGKHVFELIMKYPFNTQYNPDAMLTVAKLGKSLCSNPDALEVLLNVYDQQPHAKQLLASEIISNSCEELIPLLKKGLQSSDRVVRSNAARNLAHFRDPSIIPALIAALDLESGLSRAAIVRALGELKAKEALPILKDLYIQVKSQGGRPGFYGGQATAEISEQYESMQGLEQLAGEWQELTMPSVRTPLDLESEQLLTTDVILDAIQQIGPEASEEFYRQLARDSNFSGRKEAAIQLAESKDPERAKETLQGLMGDTYDDIRIEAAVSLVILGDPVSQPILRKLLSSPDSSILSAVLNSMQRINNKHLLCFARTELEEICDSTHTTGSDCRLANRLIAPDCP